MRALGTRWLALTVGLVALSASACILDTVDLRYRVSESAPVRCDDGERYDAATRACVTCTVLPPAPGDCLCEWDYRASGLPYCDVPEAYYACLTCKDSILSCNDLTPVATIGVLGVTRDCARIRACCDELASDHPGRVECCSCGASLRCDLDPTDPESARFIVRCDPEPSCHGAACPSGASDCLGYQACVAGECTPACNPVTETCSVNAGCTCEAVPP